MPGMKRSRRRKSRKSRRRSRRGGLSTDNPAFKAKMDLVATQAAKTQALANTAGSAVNIAANAQKKLSTDLNNLPNICKNPFMANGSQLPGTAKTTYSIRSNYTAELDNGMMLNCYPENIIFTDERLLKMIKEF